MRLLREDEMEVGRVSDWRSILKADPTEWLLERDNPSVRYFTLTEILDKPENDILVKETKEDIMKTGIVRDQERMIELFSSPLLVRVHTSF